MLMVLSLLNTFDVITASFNLHFNMCISKVSTASKFKLIFLWTIQPHGPLCIYGSSKNKWCHQIHDGSMVTEETARLAQHGSLLRLTGL